MLTFSPEGCELRWTDTKGKEVLEVLKNGHAYFIGEKVPHSLKWGQGDLILLYVAPTRAALLNKVLAAEVAITEFAWLAGDDFVAWQLIHLFRHWCQKREVLDHALMTTSARRMADYLIKAFCTLRKATAGRKDRLMPAELMKVMNYIKQHVGEKIRIDDLARLVSRSPKQFMRVFKNTTGVTALRYHRLHRLCRAEEMLQSGNYRIAEVVHELGFCDQSLLNRYFRKSGRVSPGKLMRGASVQKVATPVQ